MGTLRLDLDSVIDKSLAEKSPLASVSRLLDLSYGTQQKCEKRVRDIADYETTFGAVMKTTTVDVLGKPLVIDYVDIRAFFLMMTEQCTLFGPFLETVIGLDANAIVYMDGTVPGNPLRPDCGRAYEAAYWIFLEMPEWMRTQSKNWFPFFYVPKQDMKTAQCGVSTLCNILVEKMWLETNIDTLGFHIYSRGARKRMTLKYGGWCADDLCVYELGSCKGPNSRKPCPCCLNVVGRQDPATLRGHAYTVHVQTCWDETAFKRCTAENYADMCTRIESLLQRNATKAEIESMEIACGIRYEPTGAMFNPRARSLLRFPDLVLWDPQHNIASSGGVGQYICNEFCRQLVDNDICTLRELDEFQATVVHPKNTPPLKGDFFEERVQLQAGSHLKAFASETLSAIMVLGQYADLVLGGLPLGNVIAPYVDLLTKLRTVVRLLKLGDAVCGRLVEVAHAFRALHKAMVETAPELCKLKPHLMRHILDALERYRKNFNCFAPERAHRYSKAIAKKAFANCTRTMLVHHLHDICKNYGDSETYEPMSLTGRVALPDLLPFFKPFVNAVSVHGARKARSPMGHFSADEILIFYEGGSLRAGTARLFLKLTLASGRAALLCLLTVHKPLGGLFFHESEGKPIFLALEAIKAHCPYQKLDGNIISLIMPTAL